MYPAQVLRAAGIPLLGIIAVTLVWASRRVEAVPSLTTFALIFADSLLFAWLAVRVHRVVLLGEHDDDATQRVKCVGNYLAAIIAGSLSLSVFFAVVSVRYVPTAGGAPASGEMTGLPAWVVWMLHLAPLYLLARLSPVLPGFSLGQGWWLGDAWRLSRGNGWRMLAVVFLVPWAFDGLVDAAYRSGASPVLTGGIATLRALLTTLGIIGLSLAYRELTAAPGPPPTPPPA